MKKLLRSQGLIRRDVPEELDRRILLHAALEASRRRRTRRWRFVGAFSGMAAAAAAALMVFLPSHMDSAELLELGDWTSLEQEGFNLDSQLNCGWQELPDIRRS